MNCHLMNHQQIAVDFAVKNDGIAAFYHEIGCGKTISALALFHELRKKNPTLRLLVICPLSLIYGAWIREIEKFTEYNWMNLRNLEKRNINFPDIFLLNFEYIQSESKCKNLSKLLSGADWLCVIDESSKMKNIKTLTVKRLFQLKKYFKHRVVMSGTPAPNTEWEYWSQMYFLKESILGDNFYRFKNTHFAMRRGNQFLPSGIVLNAMSIKKMHEQGFKYEIVPAKREEMFSKMAPYCHFVKAKECIDLPDEIDEYRIIELTTEQKKAYIEMKIGYIAEIKSGNFIVANIILTKLMKLRQITSGFGINDKNEAIPIGSVNPKLNELENLIEECGDKQMIIWCQFHWEIDMIEKILTEKGHCVSMLHGRVPERHRSAHLEYFINGRNRFLIAHPDSAGHGLTLINCNIAIFFSLDYSSEAYIQAKGRIYRKGQRTNCVYFHILARNTIDEDILRILQNKETKEEIAKRYFYEKNSSSGINISS